MPVKLELIRTPRSQKRKSDFIRNEISNTYARMGRAIKLRAEKDVQDWSDKPIFKTEVKVTARRYSLRVKYDGRTLGGRKYKWVDKGTASYREKGGGRKPYTITPKSPNGVLAFSLPTPGPKTPAFDGSVAPSYTAPAADVRTKSVEHPGIKPRKFMETWLEENIYGRKAGTFHNETEAAIKRGIRKGDKYA